MARLGVFCALAALSVLNTCAQIAVSTDDLGREAVRHAKNTIPNAPLPLDVHQDVEACNQLIWLQASNFEKKSGSIIGAPLRAIRCLRIMAVDWQITSGRVVGYGRNLDDGPRWLLLFDEQSKEWFQLQGFSESLEDFNRLVRQLRVEVNDEDDVRMIFDLYRTMVKPWHYTDLVVISEIGLLEAGMYWTQATPSKDRLEWIDKWWSNNLDRKRDLSLKLKRSANGDYGVSWFVLDPPDMGLRQESISVHPDGTIGRLPQ